MRKTTQKKIDAIKKLFDFIGFTEDEAYLLHSETFNWARQLRPPVNVDFGVIYRDKGFHTEILPYIDYKRLDEIWGVEVKGIKISCSEDVCSWDEAVRRAQEGHCRLLSVDEHTRVMEYRPEINLAFVQLMSAESMKEKCQPLSHWIWAADELDAEHASCALQSGCPADYRIISENKNLETWVRYTL